jgi:hypothetical protein
MQQYKVRKGGQARKAVESRAQYPNTSLWVKVVGLSNTGQEVNRVLLGKEKMCHPLIVLSGIATVLWILL